MDPELDALEREVWARIDDRTAVAVANSALAGVCAFVLVVSSAIGVSTAATTTIAHAGPFALNQPYSPAAALGR